MSTYDTFAAYYDTLQQTDYKKVTDGLCEIFRRFSHKPHLLLDLFTIDGTIYIPHSIFHLARL